MQRFGINRALTTMFVALILMLPASKASASFDCRTIEAQIYSLVSAFQGIAIATDWNEARRYRDRISSIVRRIDDIDSSRHLNGYPVTSRFVAQHRIFAEKLRSSQKLEELVSQTRKSLPVLTAVIRELGCGYRHDGHVSDELQDATTSDGAPVLANNEIKEAQPSSKTGLRDRPLSDSKSIIDASLISILLPALIAVGLLCLVFIDRMDKRKAPRFQVEFNTMMVVKDERLDAKIHDISVSGAKLSPPLPTAKTGDQIVLSLLDQDVPARIQWAGGPYFGVQFEEQIAEGQIRLIRRLGR